MSSEQANNNPGLGPIKRQQSGPFSQFRTRNQLSGLSLCTTRTTYCGLRRYCQLLRSDRNILIPFRGQEGSNFVLDSVGSSFKSRTRSLLFLRQSSRYSSDQRYAYRDEPSPLPTRCLQFKVPHSRSSNPGKINFFLLSNLQTGSGTIPAPYSKGTGSS